MPACNIDIETYSTTLIKYGVHRYAEDPNTEIMVICWSLDNGPVQRWAFFDDIYDDLQDFIDILDDPTIELRAHNAQFERVMLNSQAGQALGIPYTSINRWRCTAVQAAMHALPRALGDCAAALGTHPKDETGKKIMLALSKPRTAGAMKGRPWAYQDRPEDYHRLVDYCADDVLAEQAIANRLPAITTAEQENYWIDQEINDRGIQVDVGLALAITDQWPRHKARLDEECRKITGGIGVNQVKPLTKWLGTKDLTANRIRDLLADPSVVGESRRVLELRGEASKTSVTKYNTLLQAVCRDERLRGMFLFDGAQTGRWSGRIVQLHNLPRNASDDPEPLIQELARNPDSLTGDIAQKLIRPTFIGGPDGMLVGDYASIELRVALWFANDQAALDKIRAGIDMYVDLATEIYKKPHDDIDKMERFVGKQAVLGLGYGMGPKKFVEYCAGQGQPIDPDLAQATVDIYRDVYRSIYSTWWKLEEAAVQAIRHPGKPITICGGKLKYVKRGDFLYCVLPSGRPITYPYPSVQKRPTPWGGETDSIIYWGVSPYTRKWSEVDTFGGRLFENVCQGTASCLLRHSIRVLREHQYPIIAHVHDEILAEGTPDELGHFTELMTRTPDWAGDLPVAVEAEHLTRYKK